MDIAQPFEDYLKTQQEFNRFLIDRKLTTEQVVTLRKDRIKVAEGSSCTVIAH